MATKSILLAVADPQALIDITQALGAAWDVTSVASEADALAQFESRSFDAFLADFNLGTPDASELLNQALEKFPETARFLLAYEADLALVAAKVLGSPQILPKPVEPDSLKTRIESGVSKDEPKASVSEPPATLSASPTIPAIYAEVLEALESSEVTCELVGNIIRGDSALSAEVLTLTNSSYLGLPRNVADPVDAVESLGLETVKGLVMAMQFLAEHSRLKPAYLSFEQLWQHSINVAQIARDLVLFETKDRALAAQALTAGLLHDLGKVILVTNFDDLYGRVYSLARKQPVSAWDVEKEMFGANHGEIGACLLGMWNLPAPIVDAAALHHEPPLGESQQLTPLAAVHIANVLEHQLRPTDDDMMVAPVINTPFLNELGLLQRLPVWRAAFANRRPVNVEPDLEGAKAECAGPAELPLAPPVRTANHLPPPASATRTTTSGPPQSDEPMPANPAPQQTRWVYAGFALVLLALLALWLKIQPQPTESQPVYARTPVTHRDTAISSENPSPQTTSVAAPAVAPVAAVVQTPTAPAVPIEVPSKPAPDPSTVPSPNLAVTNATVQPPPPQKPLPEFRLNAIIYTSVRPSAIVNGQTVIVGDQIDGATILRIAPTAVTLEINGQRKIYRLQ